MIKVKEIYPGIIHVTSPNSREIKQTWMRFEEAYENPIYQFRKFKKNFTKKDIKEWWKTTKEGKKHSYWFEAFNIPSWILNYFYHGKFNPVDKYEQELLDKLKPIWKRRKKFYVIGTLKNPGPGDLLHETAHGLYYLSGEYKRKVKEIMKKLSRKTKTKLNIFLHKHQGYGKHVLEDEKHAWILAHSFYLKGVGIKSKEISGIKKELKQLLDKTLENK